MVGEYSDSKESAERLQRLYHAEVSVLCAEFGEGEFEYETALGTIFDHDIAAMCYHGIADNRESETCTAGLARAAGIDAIEAVE